MKKVEAIIRPLTLGKVRAALSAVGIASMTIMEVRGLGRQQGHVERYRGKEYKIDFIARLKIDIIVSDEQAEECVDAIIRASRTGRIGDGKVYVSDLEQVIRIRTGEENEESL